MKIRRNTWRLPINTVRPQCGQLKEFIKILHVFLKKLLTKPPKSAVASRPVNQGIVRFAANLDYTLGGMSYESN